jgi:hypothetical protein
MQFTKTLRHLQLDHSAASTPVLKAKSKSVAQVRALQMILYGLGYSKALNWDKYRADGDYGGSTTAALSAFQRANQLAGEGRQVDAATLDRLLVLYELLPALRELAEALQSGHAAEWLVSTAPDTLIRLQQLGEQTEALQPTDLQALFTKLEGFLGPDWRHSLLEGEDGGEPRIELSAGRATVMNQWLRVRFNRKGKGVWLLGKERPLQFIETHADELRAAGLSDSMLRVIRPPSNNEGNLDAINTWDDSFLSFGMFQWTMGQRSNAGELPAFLGRLQRFSPEVFQQYFGRYGLDASTATQTTGYLTWKGARVKTVAEKEKFRKQPDWAFRFWLAGLDTTVQLVQILHAADRVRSFWRHPDYRPLDKYYIGELVTSEYGVCLLLDHHVNRPGHLMRHAIGKNDIVGRAMKAAGLTNSNPDNWGTAEETRLLEAYLPLRYRSSMTHSTERAKKIAAYRDRGLLSAERHSFVLDAVRSRGVPPVYDAETHPRVDFEEYESRLSTP